MARIGILLLNLGGPGQLNDVQPFLYNLFSDPEIIRLPSPLLQKPLAWLISTLRARKSEENYKKIGGGSPLRRITEAQAAALQTNLQSQGYDAQVYIWDAEAQTCLHVLSGHQGVIWNVKFSPTGDRIVSTSFDGTVRVWDVQTGECLQTLAGHQSFVNSACFHPHDHTLVSASRDGTLKVWDLATGNCTATLSPPKMYEGLNITGVRGLDPVQREMLLSLGAIEHSTKP